MSFDLNKLIRGRAWKFGDSIDTDSINPYYLYPTMEELKKHTLESFRPEFPREAKPGDIVVAGRNFGCGSSRPGLVLREIGMAAIVVESASRLFLRNNIARAIPIFLAPGVASIIEDADVIEVDYPNAVVRNTRTGAKVALRKFPLLVERIFKAGGLPAVARERYLAEVSARG